MACFLVTWKLTVESNSLYDALLTGYLDFENHLLNACASTALLPENDNVALALRASII